MTSLAAAANRRQQKSTTGNAMLLLGVLEDKSSDFVVRFAAKNSRVDGALRSAYFQFRSRRDVLPRRKLRTAPGLVCKWQIKGKSH